MTRAPLWFSVNPGAVGRRGGLAALLLLAAAMVLSPLFPFGHPSVDDGRTVFAHAGEWVTYPDGRRVCRLTQDLRRGDRIKSEGMCTDWTEPPIHAGESFKARDWTRMRLPDGRPQIHLERGWVP